MAISIPSGVTAGTTILENWGDSVAAAIDYLAKPPACRAFHSTTQSIADATQVAVSLDSETYDPRGLHDTVTNNSRITLSDAGIYLFTFSGTLPAATDYTFIEMNWFLNGTTQIVEQPGSKVNNAGYSELLTGTLVYKFAANDYVQARVFQDNTANTARNLSSAVVTATWLGLGT